MTYRHSRGRVCRSLLRLSALTLACGMLGGTAWAQTALPADQDAIEWHQPAQPMGNAITALALRTGLQIGVDADAVRGKQAPALEGRLTARQALLALLEGSGLEAVRGSSGSYTIRPATPAPVRANPTTGEEAAGGSLPTVTVAAGRDTVTEGTGSFTTDSPIRTAAGLPLTLRETPQSVTVITRQRMDDQGISQVSDVLRRTPGISFVQNGNSGSDSNSVYSRGFMVENFQIDGIPQAGTASGSWLQQTGDLAPYDRVEVVRGATGLLNGVGTPAATINLVRKRPTAEFQANASISAGSWNYYRGEVDIGGPINESGTVRGRIVAAVQDNESWIDRYKEQKQIFYGIVEADLTPATRLTAGVNIQQHDSDSSARSGLPLFFSDGSLANFDRSANAAASWAHSYQDQSQYFLAVDHRFDNGWTAHAAFNRSERAYDDVIGYAARGYVNRTTGAGLSLWPTRWNSEPVQNAADFHATGPFELFGRRHDLVLGYNISRTVDRPPSYTNWYIPGYDSSIPNFYLWNGDYPAEPFNPQTGTNETATNQSGAYATVRLRPTDALSVILGARVSDWSERKRSIPFSGKATFSSRSENGVVTPYAGVVYDLTDHWSVYTSYTDIFKPQTSKDLSGNTLDPLEGKAYEAGVKGSFYEDQLNVSAAVFQTDQDNLAVALPGQFAPDGSAAYRAARGTRSRGYELEAAGELMRDWQIGAGFSRSVARDADGVRLNTQVPGQLFRLFTTYRIASIGNGLTVGGGVNWQSETYSSNLGPSGKARFTQPSYGTLDLMARYQINKQLSMSVSLNNVFDKTYYTSTTSSFYGAPRNVQVTLRGTF
ncbi:TonB-dependent receptor [Variovorax sp. Sphag1AA]|uniref:TonB-dependent siderophore receptor n=1 Tax=Variovorax sp. Sphag1AA TaxID=2587027 RepID=UPI00160CAA79|nr:TonB-dependent receptor [Variovorax sp. Sphag1AA]MBB3181770.1 outer membrane receptor for ferric coprogen and ferric-rhodotorulic acid [Variovorax sp. Sphag1AA]